MVSRFLRKIFKKLKLNPFSKRNDFKLGLYGPPNGGKSTLANKICEDWLGEEMSAVSHIAHETREIKRKQNYIKAFRLKEV